MKANEPKKPENDSAIIKRSRRSNGDGTIGLRKDGRYEASARMPDGKRLKRYGRTRQEARENLKQAKLQWEQGNLVTHKDAPLKQYLEYWLQMRRDSLTIATSTYVSYRNYIQRRIIPAIGHITIQKLTGDLIQQMYIQMRKDRLSPNTIRLIHTILTAALNDAVRWKRIPSNPCKDLMQPKGKKRDMKYLIQEEAFQLMKAAQTCKIKTLLLVAVSLGLRKGELTGLHWSDIDFEKKKLHIRRNASYMPDEDMQKYVFTEQDPKTETSSRTLLLPDFLVEALREHRTQQLELRLRKGNQWEDHNLVFSTLRGKHITPSSVNKQFKRVLGLAELPDIRFHDLRHSAATILLSMGVSIKVIQELLGHANVSTTLHVYAHVTPSMQQDAMNLLDLAYQTIHHQEGQG